MVLQRHARYEHRIVVISWALETVELVPDQGRGIWLPPL
jgi:hypothetical protein